MKFDCDVLMPRVYIAMGIWVVIFLMVIFRIQILIYIEEVYSSVLIGVMGIASMILGLPWLKCISDYNQKFGPKK
jgi:hypothetical protein